MIVDDIKSLIEANGLTYGAVVDEDTLCLWFGIDKPDLSSRNHKEITEVIHKYDMAKLSAYGSINKQMLNMGMCFIQEKNIYRVPLISEMQIFIDKYYKASDKKFKNAEKLRKSFSTLFPVESKELNNSAVKRATLRSSEAKQYQPMA